VNVAEIVKLVSFDRETIALLAGAFLPMLGLHLALRIQQRRWDATKPPQEEKLLRPAGHSLALRLDELQEKFVESLLWATFWSGLAGCFASFSAKCFGAGVPTAWTLGATALFLLTVTPAIRFGVRGFNGMKEARNARLGLRGEQAVAEALHSLGDAGFRVFHDLPAGENWNIDHIAVGTKGVFLIETKTRRRRGSRETQREHEVKFDGSTLTFPFGRNTAAVPQAERNARWLTDYLAKETGEPVNVEALIVIPGWYIDGAKKFPVRAMNCDYLEKYLRGRADRLPVPQVQRIITALEKKCRTLEF
jgi:hypothetical protein